jgi:hypothetical protein
VLLEPTSILTISYENRFDSITWEVPFSFYKQFYEQVCCFVAFRMESIQERIIGVKFCSKVWETDAKTYSMLNEA